MRKLLVQLRSLYCRLHAPAHRPPLRCQSTPPPRRQEQLRFPQLPWPDSRLQSPHSHRQRPHCCRSQCSIGYLQSVHLSHCHRLISHLAGYPASSLHLPNTEQIRKAKLQASQQQPRQLLTCSACSAPTPTQKSQPMLQSLRSKLFDMLYSFSSPLRLKCRLTTLFLAPAIDINRNTNVNSS